jgi:hypothetical protein
MDSAPFVGTAVGGSDGTNQLPPLKLPIADVKRAAELNSGESPNILGEMTDEQRRSLLEYIQGRIAAGNVARGRRKRRLARIDKAISTWQKLSPEDSERTQIEDNTGKAMAVPFNLPILATHLSDMVSYYAEALAPVSNPFFSASGEQTAKVLIDQMNQDALKRNYFGELQMTLRSLIKYNIGGLRMEWDDDRPAWQPGRVGTAVEGNSWKSLDMYNTIWDPSIRRPEMIASKAEYAGWFDIVNRLELIQQSLGGRWYGLDSIIKDYSNSSNVNWYIDPAAETGVGNEAEDAKTSRNGGTVNWGDWGLGLAGDLGPEVGGFERATIYCWLVPAQFGLLTNAERDQLNDAQLNPDTFLELWRFEVIAKDYLVSAEAVIPRDQFINGEKAEIPMYLAYLTQDQMSEAQRSFMELMRGFQRFASTMYNIYVNGMRKNVYGVTVVDPTAVDASNLKRGDPVGVLESKQPGRDVNTILKSTTPNTGVDQALNSVDNTIAMLDKLFPTQSLPANIAGIDRAVKSQVATVIQGSQRSMRTLLRVIDASLMLPTRLGAFRNYRLHGAAMQGVTEEIVSKLVGSGIESMEAERVTEALWQLLYAIIQNQEAMQTFDVPALLTYIGRVGNLSVDLGQFARQPAPQQAPTQDQQPTPAA